MTTTAAANSASPSTPNDSPSSPHHSNLIVHQQQLADNNGASEQSPSPPPPSPPNLSLSSHQPPTTTSSEHQHQNNNSNQSQEHQHQQQQSSKQPQASTEQKRPMNAFLLFCKKQRSLVREKHPNLENRGITKILGDWWSKLDKEQKSKYTDLARQHKEAFMKANPDFKWCKTPMSNNNNNNNNNSSNTNSNSNDCYATNNRHTSESLQPVVHMDVVVHQPSTNSRDSFTNNRQQQLHEAPKPPKKRFLERNDSIYTTRNSNSTTTSSSSSSTSSSNATATLNNEPTSHAKDGVVPYISLDQDTLDRVIDEAFSEKSNNSPSGINMCKCSNRISTNSTSSLGVNPTPFSTSTTTITSSSYSTTTTTNNVDEPVDFSMNRTINATRQQIINNLVEKMLSGPADNACSTSKMNGTDSVQSQSGPPVKRDNPEDT